MKSLLLCACAIAAASLTGCTSASQSAAPPSPVPPTPIPITSSAAIWIHPLPDASEFPGLPPSFGGSDDVDAMLTDSSAWPHVAARTSVIGLYASWITAVSPATLTQVAAFLNSHNMSVEIEAPAMQATATCGSGVEGYAPYGSSLHDFTLAYLQRLQVLGVNVRYIKVDEPFFFGAIVPDPRSCHWPIAKVAQQVSQFAALAKTVYPNVMVGDVEPIIAKVYGSDVVSAMTQWHDTYAKANGAAFPFFFADIDFSNSAWPTLVKALEKAIHGRGIQFGIIYIGDYGDTSDLEWAQKTIHRYQTYQGVAGGDPDFVLFQSWLPHPRHCLPETDQITLTGVVKTYVDSTALSSRR